MSEILGIGTDIIAVARIRRLLDRYSDRFLNRIYTPAEQAYCFQRKDPTPHLSGRFAAKEAIVKALGTGFRNGLDWTDIEIVNDEQGKPCVRMTEKLTPLYRSTGLHISISHCKEYATATAIWTHITHECLKTV